MPRLTADLAASAPVRVNPLADRELVLRDLKIPAIENLGAVAVSRRTVDHRKSVLPCFVAAGFKLL